MIFCWKCSGNPRSPSKKTLYFVVVLVLSDIKTIYSSCLLIFNFLNTDLVFFKLKLVGLI
jgi:hypothetical protein